MRSRRPAGRRRHVLSASMPTCRSRSCIITRAAVVEARCGRAALIDEHAVRADDVARALERVAQRRAEFLACPASPSSALPASPCDSSTIRRPRRGRRTSMREPLPYFASYCVTYSARDLLHRIGVRQLLGHQHRADRQDRAVAVLAARRAGSRDWRRRASGRSCPCSRAPTSSFCGVAPRRARGADQDRIRIGRDELQHLPGHRRIGAVVLLVGDDLDACASAPNA